jgi:serine O-acetyltransferase
MGAEDPKPEARPDLEHGKFPDPEAKAMACLYEQLRTLEAQVKSLSDEQARLRAELATAKKD